MACANMTAVNYVIQRQYSDKLRFNVLFTRSRLDNAKNLYRKNLYAHYGCVNAIEFSPDGRWLVSGGDDRRVLLWDVQKIISGCGRAKSMKFEHTSNIFCLGFDTTHNRIYSGGNDTQVIIHDFESGDMLDVFLHADSVYGLSVDPTDNGLFVSASDNGFVMLWDTRCQRADAALIAKSSSAFHAVSHNPVEPRFIATANSKEGVALWDIRKPRSILINYGGYLSAQSSMSVRFNSSGTSLIALRRRLPPVLYNISSPHPVIEFDHSGYYNSCTMKSSCFAGDNDQYVMSGSDDFKLYIWKIPFELLDQKGNWVNESHLVLEGHRSIVNQVRYNKTNSIIASSGVEKIVKLWSIFQLHEGHGGLDLDSPNCKESWRKVYSHEEYINLVMESGQPMTHDYTRKSIEEDPKMMAFFDSLVQRDIEGWTTDTTQEGSSDSDSSTDRCSVVQSINSSSSSSSSSDTATLPNSPIDSLSSTLSSDSEDTEESFQAPVPDNAMTTQTISYVSNLTNRVEAKFKALKNVLHRNVPDNNFGVKPNRISELIAQKRNEQLLRSAQSTLKLTKKKLLKTMKKQFSMEGAFASNSEITATLDHEERTLESARKLLYTATGTSLDQNVQDKRKQLRKRRARIVLDLLDSSDEEETVSVIRPLTNVTYSAIFNGVQIFEENRIADPESTLSLQNNETVEENFVDSEVALSNVTESSKSTSVCNNNNNNNETEPTTSVESTHITQSLATGSVPFNRLRSKPSRRQYRSREEES